MKRYLLDTNIVLWYVLGHSRLPALFIKDLLNPTNEVFYSVICPWEIAIKSAKGKLKVTATFKTVIAQQGFEVLPINEHHVNRLLALPSLHGDPFDRMLVAQAMEERLILVTGDKALADYAIDTVIL